MHSSTICSTIGDDKNFTVAIFPCLNDNYGFLLHSEGTGETAAIDTPEVTAYNSVLERYGWTL
jgi:hydroxyacylglutathione hydrolase